MRAEIIIWVLFIFVLLILLRSCIVFRLELKNIIRQMERDANQTALPVITLKYSNRLLEKWVAVYNQRLKQSYKEKIKAEHQYKQAYQMVRGLSHDFRTPITVILGYIEWMETEKQFDNQDYLKAIKSRALLLNTSVNRLYDYFTLGDGSNALKIERFDLKGMIAQTLGDLFEYINGCEIKVALQMPKEDCRIHSDREMLERILENVLTNAAKYNTGDTIWVTLSYEKQENCYTVEVSNPSEPLSQSDLNRMFDLFYRKDKSRHDGSSGIGLSLVKSFAERIGGRVSVRYCEPVFYITLNLPANQDVS